MIIIKNCFTGLFQKGENGEMFSSMVKHYGVSKDKTQYSFYLYDDIYWSIYEGREIKKYAPIKAQDFEFAIRRLFTDNPDADVMQILKDIKNADKALKGEDISKLGVFCKDDKTLVITLSKPNEAFLEAFCDSALFPCNEEFFKSTSGRYGLSADTLIFNGSFCLSAWGESSIKLSRNTQTENPPKLSGVTLYLPKSTREHVALLKEGDIDAAMLSAEQFDSLGQNGGFSIEKNTSSVWVILFNKKHELWKNKNLRSSVISCTDRGALSSQTTGHHTAAYNIISDTASIFSKNYRDSAKDISAPAFDSKGAKELYSKALSDLSLSQILNAEILIPENELCKQNFAALNQIYQRELSLYFSPTYLSQETILSRVKSGDFAAAVIKLSQGTNSPLSSLEYFSKSSTLCIMPVTSKAFTSAMSKAISEQTAESAIKSYKKAEQALLSSGQVIPLYFENSYFVSSAAYTGFERDMSGTVLFNSVDKK